MKVQNLSLYVSIENMIKFKLKLVSKLFGKTSEFRIKLAQISRIKHRPFSISRNRPFRYDIKTFDIYVDNSLRGR